LLSAEKSKRCDEDIENGGESKSPGERSRGAFAEIGVIKMCVRSHRRPLASNVRYSKLSITCGFDAPEDSCSSARFFCAASSLRFWAKHLLVKAIDLPVGRPDVIVRFGRKRGHLPCLATVQRQNPNLF